MKYITTKKELNKILDQEQLVLLDFYADWCGPCKKLAEHFSEIEKDFPNLVIVKVDVDQANNKFTKEYGVKTIPRVVLFVDKDTVYVGDSSYKNLRAALEQHCK